MEARVAYRIQEIAFGGLSQDTRERLNEVAGQADAKENHRRRYNVAPGTRFIREYRGRRYEVTADNEGLVFEGKRYRSLSAIARKITGVRWNGHVFFGCAATKKEPVNA